jgi:hypothetical protein
MLNYILYYHFLVSVPLSVKSASSALTTVAKESLSQSEFPIVDIHRHMNFEGHLPSYQSTSYRNCQWKWYLPRWYFGSCFSYLS